MCICSLIKLNVYVLNTEIVKVQFVEGRMKFYMIC